MRLRRAVFRMSGEVVGELDDLARRLRERDPAKYVSRAAVARALVAGKLAEVLGDREEFEALARQILDGRPLRPRS